ncbi:hypothetical protein U732_69 [Clostridium argentinense CDC 2741]|uniref:Uncharacterized protein n=2 Tax=Clostridium argentinense TaxID=29341 RepID=A0A0C1UB79_9CLOT|nr:hypothetical protein [Clostridium argentinense]ARC83076.1 hypothetical protein RSJ17_00035 [Clostridium argentinense]KIE44825.1 hypothetical protein U732_69 [Clostridium argentinense CDC 2741]NFF41437.1 hypothetical protein [Clostridium argentinense]NFP51733.1 hypothetical protein [Clostridium argentinense]NFP74403.1 hypothetical protein [Clostridium argentinense]
MAKKNVLEEVENVGLGILENLNSANTENPKRVKKEISQSVSEDINNNVKTQKSKSVKEVRSKRSFMIKETSIKKLEVLKLVLDNAELSTIVEDAIDNYFEENSKLVQEHLKRYNEMLNLITK